MFLVAMFVQGAMTTANAWVTCAAEGVADAQVNCVRNTFCALNGRREQYVVGETKNRGSTRSLLCLLYALEIL